MEKNPYIIKGYFPKEFNQIRKFGKETREIIKIVKRYNKHGKINNPVQMLDGIIIFSKMTRLEYLDATKLSLLGAYHFRMMVREFVAELEKYPLPELEFPIISKHDNIKLNKEETTYNESKN